MCWLRSYSCEAWSIEKSFSTQAHLRAGRPKRRRGGVANSSTWRYKHINAGYASIYLLAAGSEERGMAMKARFNCTGCGKCCDFPPGSALIIQPSEVSRFIDKIPMYVRMAFWNYKLVMEAFKSIGCRHRAASEFIDANYGTLDIPGAHAVNKIIFRAEIHAFTR